MFIQPLIIRLKCDLSIIFPRDEKTEVELLYRLDQSFTRLVRDYPYFFPTPLPRADFDDFNDWTDIQD